MRAKLIELTAPREYFFLNLTAIDEVDNVEGKMRAGSREPRRVDSCTSVNESKNPRAQCKKTRVGDEER